MKSKTSHYFVYILECRDGRLYTGITTDLKRRLNEHKSRSKKSKYTRAFPVQRLLAYWKLDCALGSALKIERKIKSLPKQKKEALIQTPHTLSNLMIELNIAFIDKTLA